MPRQRRPPIFTIAIGSVTKEEENQVKHNNGDVLWMELEEENIEEINDNLCVELDLLFDFSVPHAGGCRKLGLIL